MASGQAVGAGAQRRPLPGLWNPVQPPHPPPRGGRADEVGKACGGVVTLGTMTPLFSPILTVMHLPRQKTPPESALETGSPKHL